MKEVVSEIYRRYGAAALVAVAAIFVLIWTVAHYTAAPGGNVSILWGVVQYTKRQPALSQQSSVPQSVGQSDIVAHDMGFADVMVIGGWFRHTLSKPCIVRITTANDNINFRNILAKIISDDGECGVSHNGADSQVAPTDADATGKPPDPGVIVRGSEDHAKDLAKLLSGLGMKASWGSRQPDGGQIQIDIGSGSPWSNPRWR